MLRRWPLLFCTRYDLRLQSESLSSNKYHYIKYDLLIKINHDRTYD